MQPLFEKRDLAQKKKVLTHETTRKSPLRDNPDLADARGSRLKYRSLSLFDYLSYALSYRIRYALPHQHGMC